MHALTETRPPGLSPKVTLISHATNSFPADVWCYFGLIFLEITKAKVDLNSHQTTPCCTTQYGKRMEEFTNTSVKTNTATLKQ